jgi:hypothetical protein
MPTIDDLRQAFTRLEARTPLEIDTLPTVAAGTAAMTVELVPATATPPRQRAALIGSGLAVAATITGAILLTGLAGGSGTKHVPAGGTLAPAVSTTSTGAPAAAPSAAADGPSTGAATPGAAHWTCAAAPNGVVIPPCVSPTVTPPIPQSSLTRAAP